jgi:hypothetical protein
MKDTDEVKSTTNYALLKLPDHAFIYEKQRDMIETRKNVIKEAITTYGSIEAVMSGSSIAAQLLVVVDPDNFEIIDEVYNYYAFQELGLPVFYILT